MEEKIKICCARSCSKPPTKEYKGTLRVDNGHSVRGRDQDITLWLCDTCYRTLTENNGGCLSFLVQNIRPISR